MNYTASSKYLVLCLAPSTDLPAKPNLNSGTGELELRYVAFQTLQRRNIARNLHTRRQQQEDAESISNYLRASSCGTRCPYDVDFAGSERERNIPFCALLNQGHSMPCRSPADST